MGGIPFWKCDPRELRLAPEVSDQVVVRFEVFKEIGRRIQFREVVQQNVIRIVGLTVGLHKEISKQYSFPGKKVPHPYLISLGIQHRDFGPPFGDARPRREMPVYPAESLIDGMFPGENRHLRVSKEKKGKDEVARESSSPF